MPGDDRENHPRLTRQLVVRVDEILYRALVADAETRGESVGATVRRYVREGMGL